MSVKFTKDILYAIKEDPANKYLSECPASKYEKFKSKDPFPHIPSALLNSEDIVKYILTTGMIDPFIPENLEDATYICTFSGTYLRYDSNGQAETKTLSEDDELCIEPNSITYLEIEERFMIPLYMVLRFNLKVQNVYKGLLLGTGPIVDPGFVGKLYIPLHNLTLNEYVIKPKAQLISVEFTKLSLKDEWKILSQDDKFILDKLNFEGLPSDIQKGIPNDREIFVYIKKSLQDEKFHKEPKDKLSISSSLANYASQLKTIGDSFSSYTKEIDGKVNSYTKGIDDKVNSSIEKVEKQTKTGVIFSMVTVFITSVSVLIGMLVPTWQSFNSLKDELHKYQDEINELENQLLKLEFENKQIKLDILRKEYDSLLSKDSSEAEEMDKQINALEEEIAELQDQLL